MLNYFNFNSLFKTNSGALGFLDRRQKKGEIIMDRRQRFQIEGFRNNLKKKAFFFKAGDILKLSFKRGGQGYYFEGICLAIKKSQFKNKHTILILRNVINGVGIEIVVSYYLNRLYYLNFSDYKRKRLFYDKKKLFYLRFGLNKEGGL